jgi:hypothetical protein
MTFIETAESNLRHRPLLESGTQGLLFDSSVYLPHITSSYTGGSDNDVGAAVPVCTIKEFPTNAQHCLMFAKSEFIMEFTNVPNLAKSVLHNKAKPADPDCFLILDRISESMVNLSSFEQCIAWAHGLYLEYVFRIQTLTLEHPQDEVTDTGKFWTPPKRYPTTAAYDHSEPLLRNFVFAAAVLKAKTCSIVVPESVAAFSFPIENAVVKPFPPSLSYRSERSLKLDLKRLDDLSHETAADAGVIKAQQTRREAEHNAFKEAEIARILAALSQLSESASSRFQSIDFNKDDAAHM